MNGHEKEQEADGPGAHGARSDMSGSAGDVVQARDISGGIHFHPPPPLVPPPPVKPPARPRTVTLTRRLVALLAAGAVGLVGLGGLLGSRLASGDGGPDAAATGTDGTGNEQERDPGKAQDGGDHADEGEDGTQTDARLLTELTAVDGWRFDHGTGVAVNGAEFDDALITSSEHCSQLPYVDYDLGRSWSRLTFTAGASDTSPSDERMRLTLFGDGAELERIDVTLGASEEYDIDVSGVLRLRIVGEGLNDYTCIHEPYVVAVLGTPTLHP